MAALNHPCNDIVAPETDGQLELREDLRRCELNALTCGFFALSERKCARGQVGITAAGTGRPRWD
jgi:hypothetical protein